VDTNRIFSDTLVALRSTIAEPSATITSDLMPEVRADSQQLARLFQNLLSNSLKYRCPDRPPKVHVAVERKGIEWIFSVHDNGIGIDPQYGSKIFQPFQRLHGREIPGTGLGLAICKRIVERLGGQIWLEARSGEGSTFLFSLPSS